MHGLFYQYCSRHTVMLYAWQLGGVCLSVLFSSWKCVKHAKYWSLDSCPCDRAAMRWWCWTPCWGVAHPLFSPRVEPPMTSIQWSPIPPIGSPGSEHKATQTGREVHSRLGMVEGGPLHPCSAASFLHPVVHHRQKHSIPFIQILLFTHIIISIETCVCTV